MWAFVDNFLLLTTRLWMSVSNSKNHRTLISFQYFIINPFPSPPRVERACYFPSQWHRPIVDSTIIWIVLTPSTPCRMQRRAQLARWMSVFYSSKCGFDNLSRFRIIFTTYISTLFYFPISFRTHFLECCSELFMWSTIPLPIWNSCVSNHSSTNTVTFSYILSLREWLFTTIASEYINYRI